VQKQFVVGGGYVEVLQLPLSGSFRMTHALVRVGIDGRTSGARKDAALKGRLYMSELKLRHVKGEKQIPRAHTALGMTPSFCVR
jgi:hypothetical protein